MENKQHDGRKTTMVVDIDMPVPKTHLLRKIDKVMDYDWIYERLEPYYNKRVARPIGNRCKCGGPPVSRLRFDAKEKHAMRYTHLRRLARVTQWVRLKFAALNLKKPARWLDKSPLTGLYFNAFDSFAPHFLLCVA